MIAVTTHTLASQYFTSCNSLRTFILFRSYGILFITVWLCYSHLTPSIILNRCGSSLSIDVIPSARSTMYITWSTNRLLVAINVLLLSRNLNLLYPPFSGDSMTNRNLNTLRSNLNRVLWNIHQPFTRVSGIPIIFATLL